MSHHQQQQQQQPRAIRAAAAAGAAGRRDAAEAFRIVSGGAPCTIGAASASSGSTSGDGLTKLATFDGLAYSGAPMKPEGWYQPVVVDLAGVKIPSQHRPALRQHDHQQIVGHTTRVWADAEGIHVSGVFSGQAEHVAKVTEPARNGFEWQLSIGANPTRTEYLEAGEETQVNGRTVSGPLTISRETEIGEVSFVPLGADGDTSATVNAAAQQQRRGRTRPVFKAMLKQLMKARGDKSAPPGTGHYSDEQIDKMSEDECKAALKKRLSASDDDDDDDDDDGDEEKKAEASRKQRIQAERKAVADEINRCDQIKARCRRHGVEACEVETPEGNKVKVSNLAAHAIEQGWTPDHAELLAMRAARPGPGVGLVPGGLAYNTTSPEISEAVLEAAVLEAAGCQLFETDFFTRQTQERDRVPVRTAARIQAELSRRYPDQVRQAAHTHFRGRIGLHQLLTTIAAANGYRGRETLSDGNYGEVAAYANPPAIRADGPSMLSVANVTANVQNKFMLMGYLFTEQAWREVCAIRSVKDFKPTKSINLFGDVEFKEVPNSGELDNANFSDQAFANQVRTHGRIITIPRSTIINDDLGAFGQIPMLLGRGAGLKLNKTFWMRFMSPGLDDGGSTNFYASTHTLPAGQVSNSNLMSGASSALSSDSLTTATKLFDNQVDPKGYPLGMDAEILLYPSDLQTAALELMNSQWIIMSALGSTSAASKQPSENIWKGRYRPVKSRYLNKTLTDTISGTVTTVTGSTTAWWLLANPGLIPVIEVAFLNGVDAPTVQQASPDFQFNILGISTRAFFDMDANSQNHRGGVKSNGV